MSHLLCLTGRGSSSLQCSFSPPIALDEDKRYEIGLVNFITYNSIFNVTPRTNQLRYKSPDNNNDPYKTLKIAEGAYELEDLESYLKEHLDPSITVTVNANTLKTRITTKLALELSESNNNVGKLLGFTDRQRGKYNLLSNGLREYVSEKDINISPTNVINVHCNIVRQSYANGKPSHILYSFAQSVPIGYKIEESPRNIIYLPVYTDRVTNLSVEITDQDQNLIDFHGEEIAVSLHLRPAPM